MEIKTLKGFKDFLPEEEFLREAIKNTLINIFKRHNLESIDTPSLEYSKILLSKGSQETDKQIYKFEDHGKRSVALRFDLTVPFARFIAMHKRDLTFPFKRYHIGKVWRGENTQKGRYREFTQCDFDIVGSDSFLSDFEILLIAFECLKALKVKEFKIKFSNRALLNSFFSKLNINEKSVFILRTIDKVLKVGKDKTLINLTDQIEPEKAEQILEFIQFKGNYEEKIEYLKSLSLDSNSIESLNNLYFQLKSLKIEDFFELDLSIARGLDYYTGLIFETEINSFNIGSVCSGGRYDNLIASYSKDKISGVGASFGLERLLDVIQALNLKEQFTDSKKILIANIDFNLLNIYNHYASKIRDRDIICEVYPDFKKIKEQIKYAQNKNINYIIFLGQEERIKNKLRLKNLNTREETLLSFEELLNYFENV